MIATPNTTVNVLRGTVQDEFGDDVDADTVAIAAVPAWLVERSRTVYGPNVSQDRVVRTVKCRVPAGTGVLKGDRVKDLTSGQVYVVDDLYQLQNPFWTPDLALDLKYTN